MRLRAIRVRTGFWRPGADYVREIVGAVEGFMEDGDVVSVSEKAVSTARGLVVDESRFEAGRVARFLASFWMRRIWGGPLGRLTGLRDHTIERLRAFPEEDGAVHKQVALSHTGILQSLRHYSEGGIDASNLPYALVSLPLPDPRACASEIREALEEGGWDVSVLIVDGDTRRLGLRRVLNLGGLQWHGATTVNVSVTRWRSRPARGVQLKFSSWYWPYELRWDDTGSLLEAVEMATGIPPHA